MKLLSRLLYFPLMVCSVAALCGCVNLKQAPPAPRYFVLTSVMVDATAQSAPASFRSIKIAPIQLPGYLVKSAFAVRVGTNQIEYVEDALWAERLDQGMQRVLMADLSTSSHLRNRALPLELHLDVQQFDVDTKGKATLAAAWEIRSGGGILKSGNFRSSRPGPEPQTNLAGAVGTLSGLVGELGNELGKTLEILSGQK